MKKSHSVRNRSRLTGRALQRMVMGVRPSVGGPERFQREEQLSISDQDIAARFPETYPPEKRTLPEMLRHQAEIHGDNRLLVFREEVWTYAEALEIAARFAGMLAEAGIKHGDRVAILCTNRPEFLRVVLGCGWLGAIAVPVNTATRGMQFEHILNTSGACMLVAERDLLPALEGLSVPALKTVWVIDAGEAVERMAVDGREYLPLPASAQAVPPARVSPADTLVILFTSGTTGPSKGVCCPHAQYFWWAFHTASLLGVRGDDVLLTSLPLFHTNALNSVFQALLSGATLVVEPRFSVSNYFSALARHGATVTYLLGAMVPMLLSRAEGPDTKRHRTRIALAPGTPGEMFGAFKERFGIGLVDGYGATETNFVIGSTSDQVKPGMMGTLRPGFEAKVVDENDEPVAAGEPGELILRADEPFAFSTGYFGMPEKTVEVWRNLWFHSGDRVVQEKDGYFRFLDRMKDAIRRRGENISSYEVEQVLVSHPWVENAAAFPVRSELAEDEVMVAVVLKDGATLSPEALLDFCSPRMPYFSVPRFVDFVEALPMTPNGKVTKFALRDQGVTETTWDRDAAGYQVERTFAAAEQTAKGAASDGKA